MVEESDSDLVACIRQGNLDAFERLYHRHKRVIFRAALAMTGDRGLAEEVLQDTFVRMYQHIHTLHGDPSLAPWLYRVAMNLCHSRLRRKRGWLVSLEDLVALPRALWAASPEDTHHAHEQTNTLATAVARLPTKQRAVVVLYYLEEFSLEEIAYILQCPVGTVKSRLHGARQTLAAALGAAPLLGALQPA